MRIVLIALPAQGFESTQEAKPPQRIRDLEYPCSTSNKCASVAMDVIGQIIPDLIKKIKFLSVSSGWGRSINACVSS